jgi:hypothetical protein
MLKRNSKQRVAMACRSLRLAWSVSFFARFFKHLAAAVGVEARSVR